MQFRKTIGIKRAVPFVAAACVALSGCAALNQIGQQTIGADATAQLGRSLSDITYRGQVWNMPYVISRNPVGTYYIRKLSGTRSSSLGRLISLRKVYSTQTKTFGVDVFAAPTRTCPHHYLLVIGRGNDHGQFKSLGCMVALSFQDGVDGRVYATQEGLSSTVPLAYVIGARRLHGPKPITQLAGYPQRGSNSPVTRSTAAQPARVSRDPVANVDDLGPVPVPEAVPARRNQTSATGTSTATPVTVDLGGSTH